jgi:hypothetical protein
MKIKSDDIIAQVERLAEACPWDDVDLWTRRTPEGKYDFTAYVRDNPTYGLKSVFGNGKSPNEAVTDAIKQTANRDPEISRRLAIAELQSKIEKLQAVVIGLPPYRPGRILGNGQASIEVPSTVDV